MLQVTEKNQKYGLTAILPQPLDPTKGLVLQYEVQFIEGHECSGAYLKLLPHDDAFKPEQLEKDAPYTIMFGPDRCGPNSRVSARGLGRLNPNMLSGRREGVYAARLASAGF